MGGRDPYADHPVPGTPLERLSSQLPLAARHAALPPDLAARHREILTAYVATGRAPSLIPADATLAAADLVVIGDGEVAGAYPFSSESTPHRLHLVDAGVHAMCALDAVAVGAVLGTTVEIDSTCAVSGEPVRIVQEASAVVAADPADIRVGIRWQDPIGCAAHSMCRDMVFVRAGFAPVWIGEEGDAAVLTLDEAIALGDAFFRPLFTPPLL